MDPLSLFLKEFAARIAGLPDAVASLILRSLLFFGAITGITGWAFHRGSRSQFTQTMAATVGLLIATFFPVGWLIHSHPTIKASLLTLSLVALVFLPAQLPFYLTPNRRHQNRIRIGAYGLLLGCLVLALP